MPTEVRQQEKNLERIEPEERERSGLLPPAPNDQAERAFVDAVAKAVLDWAGLDPEEADAPGYQTIPVPNRACAELIGLEALSELRLRGLRVAGAPSS